MQAAQTAEKPNFDTVWAIMQENALQIKELRESQKETERILKERAAELNIRIGSLTNLFGDFTLGMVAPKLCDKFMEFGLVFPRANKEVEITDKINNISLEIDIMLENGDKAMLVEIKTKLTTDRINKHIERLEKMRMYADLHGDKRIFLGAVAGFAISDDVKNYALKHGLYLIEPDGENINVTPPNDKPKEW